MTTSDSSLKRCFKCGLEKDRSEFYAHPMMGDGLLGKCKECTKRDVKRHRDENLKYYRNYDLARYYAEGHRGTPSREAARRGSERWVRDNPHKAKAQRAAANAIRDGRLVRKPCEKCGSDPADAHHDDYSKPLDVRWLCRKCHCEHHRRCVVTAMVPPSGNGGWGRVRTFDPEWTDSTDASERAAP